MSLGSSGNLEGSKGHTRKGRREKHPENTPQRRGKYSEILRAGFRQNGFFADFYFWAAGFFRGFPRRIFSPHFCGKKCPEKSSRENPRENPPNFVQQKSSNTFLQIGRGKNSWLSVLSPYALCGYAFALFQLSFCRVSRKGGVASRVVATMQRWRDEVKLMKTMRIHPFIAFASLCALFM